MICSSTNRECLDFVFLRDAAEIGPQTLPQIRSQERFPILRAPNAMNETAIKGMHAARFFRPWRDLTRISRLTQR